MIKKVKIFGSGSIGNHMANASRLLGWDVTICDISSEALKRAKTDIYPSRYKTWDNNIKLFLNNDAPIGEFDLIIIGTPPDTHIKLARDALIESPKAILIEKPLCTPDLNGVQELMDEAKSKDIKIFTGYDHVVGKASMMISKFIREKKVKNINTIDVEFREHWGGIFRAHPWLDGPADSYLGYWKRGGGASGEHSHAINLWQYFAHEAGYGKITEVSAQMNYIKDGSIDYDSIALLNVRTEKGLLGRVVQDVVTLPTRKWARIQAKNGFLEWNCGNNTGDDEVLFSNNEKTVDKIVFSKTRPDDFVAELTHINETLNNKASKSQISFERGLETMMVIVAAHLSSKEKRVISIDYSKGFTQDAFK